MTKRKTTIEFIQDARRVHGKKYDYSKTEYITNNDNISLSARFMESFGRERITTSGDVGVPSVIGDESQL